MRFKVVRICNSEANTCIPLEPVRFDLDRTAEKLRELGYSVENKGLMVVASKDGVEYTDLPDREVAHPSHGEGSGKGCGGRLLPSLHGIGRDGMSLSKLWRGRHEL